MNNFFPLKFLLVGIEPGQLGTEKRMLTIVLGAFYLFVGILSSFKISQMNGHWNEKRFNLVVQRFMVRRI